jgi:BASS family bile acid:Na+ symporter
VLRRDSAQLAALTFGLRVNNNGPGLVLAAMPLAHRPRVLLPIILYNLAQHLVAAVVRRVFFRARSQRPCGAREGAPG